MMTPKLFSQIFIIALSVFIFSSCSKDSSVTVQPPAAFHGAFVSYENAHVGGSDYCFVDLDKDTVFNNLYENTNGSAFIDGPGKIALVGGNIYMVCAGLPTQGGRIYEVNSTTNHLIKSQAFGNSPRSFEINGNNIFVSSSGGAYVTQFDLNLSFLNDFVSVGFTPGKVSYAFGRFFVCKSTTSNFRELAIVNETSVLVTQVSYNFLPLALVNNSKGYYLTGGGLKCVYHLDSVTYNPIDSIVLPTTGSSVGDMVKEGDLKMLVAVDSMDVWEINLASSPPTSRLLIPFPGGRYKISAMGYESLTGRIFVVDIDGGPPFYGILHIDDPVNGSQLKSYTLIGRNPNSIVFKY